MKRLEFDENSKLADVLRKIQQEEEPELEIFTPPQVSLLKLGLNKEVIRAAGQASGKKIFFRDELVAKKPVSPQELAAAGTAGEVAAENLGFVEGKDIAHEAAAQPPPLEDASKKKRFSLPKIPFAKFLKGPKWLYFLGGFIILIIVGIGFLYLYLPSASVELFTEKQTKEAELTILASATAEKTDVDKGIIPLKTLEATEEDNAQADATGTKTVGTPATGRVRIVNHDVSTSGPPAHDGSKTFWKGTILTTTSGPKVTFSLDDVATVSAAILPNNGEASANVTATTIGDQGNLPAGTVFQIGSASVVTVFATNDTNFSGGTSKKTTVISADDQSKAKNDLLKKLEDKAKADLQKENPGIVIPDGGIESAVLEETYSNKVDEEVANFQLSLKVKFTAKTFSGKDLKDLLVASIADSLPHGYSVDQQKSTVESTVLEKIGDDLKISGKIKAELVPDINIDEVRKNITGKSFADTDSYLKSLAGISEFDIKINPSAFRIFGTMPLLGRRIDIKIEEKQ